VSAEGHHDIVLVEEVPIEVERGVQGQDQGGEGL